MNSNPRTARLAGFLYLLLALSGMLSLMYVPSVLIVEGNAAETVANITASPSLYRIGIVSGLVCQTSFLVLAIVLYQLLRHVNGSHALAMLVFVVSSVPIMFIVSVNELEVLALVSGKAYLNSPEELYKQVLKSLSLRGHGILVAEIFWGLWLFPLGYLVYTSNMFPKVLGVLLMVSCLAYLIGVSVAIFAPHRIELTYPGAVVSAVAEFSFLLWLMIKGVKQQGAIQYA